jgi:hypothetical protein
MCVSTADMHGPQYVVAVSDPLWPRDTHGTPRWQLSVPLISPINTSESSFHRICCPQAMVTDYELKPAICSPSLRSTTLALPETRAAWRRACVLVISRGSTTCIPRRTSRSPNRTLHWICRRWPDVEDMLRMSLERDSSPRFCWIFL